MIYRIISGAITLLMLTIVFGVCSSSAAAATEMKLIRFWDDSEPSSIIDVDHAPLQEILQKYIVADHPSGISRFNYALVSESDTAKLQQYLEYLQLLEPRQLNEAEAKAYWVNLYNAATLNMVIEAYASGRVNKVKARGLSARRWRRDIVTIAQQDMSLDDILHGVIRPLYKDPRMHYAVFFCTLGGPDMPVEVMNGENNETLLNQFEVAYLNQGRAVRLENGELVLSEMFKTYDTDFASDQYGLVSYLKQHVAPPLADVLDTVSDVRFEYDWTVNAP